MLGSVQYHLCFHISQVIFLCVPFTLPHSLLLSSPTHLPTYQRTNAPNRRHRRHRDRGGGGADLHRRPRLQLYQNALRTHRRRVRPARPVNTVTDTVTDAVTDTVIDTVTQYDVTPWLSHCIRHIRSACAPSAVPEPCRNAVWREREWRGAYEVCCWARRRALSWIVAGPGVGPVGPGGSYITPHSIRRTKRTYTKQL